MSFKVNNQELGKINFNNQKVYSVYYNDVLVWEAPLDFVSVGWDYLYNLCKAKQAGTITEWPNYIQLGEIKTVSYTDWEGYTRYLPVRLIDIETEGPGILVFQLIMPKIHPSTMGSGIYLQNYGDTDLGDIENGVYGSDLSISEYIKPLKKGGEEKRHWFLSANEMGETLDKIVNSNGATIQITGEFTEGISTPYPYMTIPENRIAKVGSGDNLTHYSYWLRTGTGVFGIGHYYVDTDGTIKDSKPQHHKLGCFAIG